jgi:hypothetical protein
MRIEKSFSQIDDAVGLKLQSVEIDTICPVLVSRVHFSSQMK